MDSREAAKILGIESAKSFKEIKDKFKHLAIQYHPDRNSDITAADKFKQISEAFSVLDDYHSSGGKFPIPVVVQPIPQPSGSKTPSYTIPKSPPPPKVQPPQSTPSTPNTKLPKTKIKTKPLIVKRKSGQSHQSSAATQNEGSSSYVYNSTPVDSRTTGTQYNMNNPRSSIGQYIPSYDVSKQMFNNETKINTEIKSSLNNNFDVRDVKHIVLNHLAGNPPINVDYQRGPERNVQWDVSGHTSFSSQIVVQPGMRTAPEGTLYVGREYSNLLARPYAPGTPFQIKGTARYRGMSSSGVFNVQMGQQANTVIINQVIYQIQIV